MKTTYRFILAAFAAMAMISCTKDITADRQDTGLQDGVRTIAVSFAAQTKTTLDGLQPRFDDGDVIKVSNGSACEDIAVQIDPQGNAFFTTTLTGVLKAVYPATAAKLNGKAIEDVIVPAIQTGRFKEANICMANIDANAKEATFQNKTAILRFYVDRSVDVRAIAMSSNGQPITTETIRITDKTLPENYIYVFAEIPEKIEDAIKNIKGLKPLYQATDDPDKRICYVSILPVSETDIEFKGVLPDYKSGMVYNKVTLNEGDIANAFIPYYINVKVGGTDDEPVFQRWSYCNIGAFLPEEAGYYYTWANLAGYWKNGIPDGYVFSEENYNNTVGSDIITDIPLGRDAAVDAWANGEENTWRMPSKAEFEALLNEANPSVSDEGLVFAEGLKFPFAGRIEGSNLILKFESYKAMSYWSSTFNDEGSAFIMVTAFAQGDDPIYGCQPSGRHIGIPIRPIYGAPAEPEVDPAFIQVQEFEDKGNI